MPGRRDTGGRDDAQMPEAGHADLHRRPPTGRVVSPLARHADVARLIRRSVPARGRRDRANGRSGKLSTRLRTLSPTFASARPAVRPRRRRRRGARLARRQRLPQALRPRELRADRQRLRADRAHERRRLGDVVRARWLEISRLVASDALLVFSVGGGSREHNVSVNLVSAIELARRSARAIYGVVGSPRRDARGARRRRVHRRRRPPTCARRSSSRSRRSSGTRSSRTRRSP